MHVARVLSLLALAVLLVGAATPVQRISDPARTYSLNIPSGWTSHWDGGILRLIAPARTRGFRGNVGIEVLNRETSLTPARKHEFRAQLKALLPRMHVDLESDGTIAGAPGWKICYEGVLRDGPITGCSIVFSRNHHTWIFTFLTSNTDWEANKADVDGLLQSFTLL